MKQNVLVVIVAAVSLLVGVLLAVTLSNSESAEPKYLQMYPQARQLADFELYNQRGEAVTKETLRDHWTLTFVGYTFCPDICPTTLAELKRIYPELQKIESEYPIQVLFLSVDPNRDTQSRLDEYVQFFNPDFIAASAEHKQLFPLVRSMGMMYAISDNIENPNYLVDHSSSIIVIDPSANVIGRFKPHQEPGKLAVSDGDQILADMPNLVNL
jgi:protein SCO1/2